MSFCGCLGWDSGWVVGTLIFVPCPTTGEVEVVLCWGIKEDFKDDWDVSKRFRGCSKKLFRVF